MQDFHRDSAEEQTRIRRAYEDAAAREADAQMAAYRRSLARGASVARDEGEVGQPAPGWLSDYMQSQQPTDPRIAMIGSGLTRGY